MKLEEEYEKINKLILDASIKYSEEKNYLNRILLKTKINKLKKGRDEIYLQLREIHQATPEYEKSRGN